MAGNGGRREGSGRKPLIQNKISRDLKAEAQAAYPNFNPLTELFKFYHETEDEKLRLDCLKEINKKFVPDLKSVDVVSNGESLVPPSIIQLIGNPPED